MKSQKPGGPDQMKGGKGGKREGLSKTKNLLKRVEIKD